MVVKLACVACRAWKGGRAVAAPKRAGETLDSSCRPPAAPTAAARWTNLAGAAVLSDSFCPKTRAERTKPGPYSGPAGSFHAAIAASTARRAAAPCGVLSDSDRARGPNHQPPAGTFGTRVGLVRGAARTPAPGVCLGLRVGACPYCPALGGRFLRRNGGKGPGARGAAAVRARAPTDRPAARPRRPTSGTRTAPAARSAPGRSRWRRGAGSPAGSSRSTAPCSPN
ncbi:hypothetical protein KOR34_48170 [Posidoniimonas corsicana]|uniref:Uncharacterized protein n=1 Tax=Posidoniimonas corsicana TaxID=1938618 RepID=A0A5C5UWM0_9BACT|nr:hypothetical protein KOR34_48170 [Posidoniimonas corsicana]